MAVAANLQIVCSLMLTFGVPMAIAMREYWSLRVAPGGLPEPPMVEPEPLLLPDAGVGALPACLVPRRVRELA